MPTLSDDAKYAAAIQGLSSETQTFWSISQTFLLAATLLAGFLLQSGLDKAATIYRAGTLLGVLIGILWFVAVSRSADYHKLRAMQARLLEGGDTTAIMTLGEVFRRENKIVISGESHKASLTGRLNILSGHSDRCQRGQTHHRCLRFTGEARYQRR
jgi:hypothetical protein